MCIKKSQSTGREKWNVRNEISPDVFVSIVVDDFETNPFTIRPIARMACPTTIFALDVFYESFCSLSLSLSMDWIF